MKPHRTEIGFQVPLWQHPFDGTSCFAEMHQPLGDNCDSLAQSRGLIPYGTPFVFGF